MLRSMMRMVLASLVGLAIASLSTASGLQADPVDEKAIVCAVCHGEQGIPADKSIPIIWGQMEGYLYLQLRDMKKGFRQNDVMSQIVAGLDRDEMLQLAAYFAAKPWPNLNQPAAPDTVTGVALMASASIGCQGCHLSKFEGTGTVPRLAGQSHDYLAKTIDEFRSGVRANNPGMTSLMKATSPADLMALATYLAGL